MSQTTIYGADKLAQWLRPLASGTAFEVEFSDRDGRTFESIGLHPDQIMVLHFEPESPDLKSAMVGA